MRRQCTRFRRDGTRCVHDTDYEDGWCRRPECPGFTRASVAIAPESSGRPSGTARHRGQPNQPLVTIAGDVADEVRLSQRAIDSFRFHHGGSEAAARAQLRTMLDDFLRDSARKQTSRGAMKLAHSGFVLVLSPRGDIVVSYSTIHRERTWAQVKAGVPSRFKRTKLRPGAPVAEPFEIGPPVALDLMTTTVDPATVRLSLRALNEYAALRDLGDDYDAAAAALRAELAESLPEASVTDARDGTAALLIAHNTAWLVSIDGRALISVVSAQGS